MYFGVRVEGLGEIFKIPRKGPTSEVVGFRAVVQCNVVFEVNTGFSGTEGREHECTLLALMWLGVSNVCG